MVETSRRKFIANLPVKLLMQWFGRCAIQPNHFKSHYRMATPFPMKIWRWIFGVPCSAFSSDHEKSMSISASKSNYPSKVVWPFRCKWTVDTLPHGQKLSFKCRLKLRVPITLKQKA